MNDRDGRDASPAHSDESSDGAQPTSSGDTSPPRKSSTPPSSAPPDEVAKHLLPELVRKVVEAGIERLADGPENVRQRLGDLKLPKEALSSLLAQIDGGKSGLYRVLAKEMRDFLESTNFTEELVRALTMLSFEIRMEVRLIPNDSGRPRPNVKSNVRVRQNDEKPSASPQDATNEAEKKHK